MKELVSQFTNHLSEALQIAESSKWNALPNEVSEVLILGMGGSGIGGTIAAQVISEEISVPVLSCKDYMIPSFVSSNTLVIASSYSGNTEETLMALEAAEKKSAMICCVTSGGQLKELAESKGYNCIVIPGGMPPRGAFGYSFPQVFKVLQHAGLISKNYIQSIEKAIQLLEADRDDIMLGAGQMANQISDKIAIIYTQSDFEGVAIRFRQQLNENSKKLCWHHVFPEMNHNELVGWREKRDDIAVVILRNDTDHPRNQVRFDLCKGIFKKYTNLILELKSKGADKLQKTLYLIHFCDWVSVLVAEQNNTDPIEIEVINYLKSELAKS